MKTKLKFTKLALLTFVLTFFYGIMVGNYIATEWDDIKLGFTQGSNAISLSDNNDSLASCNTYFLQLKPKKGFISFPDSVVNQKNGQVLKAKLFDIRVAVPNGSSIHKSVRVYSILQLLLTLITLLVILFMPIQFIKLLDKIKNEIIFDERNAQILRKIGIGLIIFYILSFISNFISFKINKELFSLSEYSVDLNSTNATSLIFGATVLIFAEIISRGLKLKEEHELTI